MTSYFPGFLSSFAASAMFQELWDNLNWERRPDAPRREFWSNDYDRDYTYGQGAGVRTYAANPYPKDVLTVRDMLDHQGYGYFEGCFLNGYEGARDWLGWHSDDDHGIDHSKAIAVVTLYSDPNKRPRSIQFRHNFTQEIEDIPLEHGSLCIMAPGSQFTHQHRIPKAGFDCADRISLTFRSLIYS